MSGSRATNVIFAFQTYWYFTSTCPHCVIYWGRNFTASMWRHSHIFCSFLLHWWLQYIYQTEMRLQYKHLTVMENLKKETSGKPAGTTSLKWSPGNRGELQKYRQSRTAWGPFENDGHAVCRDSRRISLAYPVTNYPHSGQSKSPIRLLCGKMERKDSGSELFQQIPTGNLWLILLEMLPRKGLLSVNSLPHFDTVCQINRPEKVENQLKPLRQTQNILIYHLLKEFVNLAF